MMTDARLWPCVAAAQAHDPAQRLPLWLWCADWGSPELVGSVARADLPALAAWPQHCQQDARGLNLHLPRSGADALLADINQRLRTLGLIRAWRDEPYALWAVDGRTLGVIERASARFWGVLTLGAHCNGYVADATGRPSHLWVARRADDKPTDPGRLDNLIGGGVPLGQSPSQALRREAWEEAGLRPEDMAPLRPGRVLHVMRDNAEGLQREWLYVYDLALPADRVPENQDGEVAELRLLPIDEALAVAASGQMTVDAALATLDFALRHRLLPAELAAATHQALAPWWVDTQAAARFDPFEQ